jgi:hypothetical protein
MENEKKVAKLLVVNDGPDAGLMKKVIEFSGANVEMVNGPDGFPPSEPPKPIEFNPIPKPQISRKQFKKLVRLAAHAAQRKGHALPCEKSNSQLRRERKAAEAAPKASK